MSDELESKGRFSIFVPKPKARINLGKADPHSPFGYTGVSIQSDVHLFLDCNKLTLFQTGKSYCGQVGGQWLQWSNENMYMSCTANMNLSADAKITIAAGAGQGQVTAKDHDNSGMGIPQLVPYNNLQLHYLVDSIQNGLFEFFHGRRERQKIGSFKEYFTRKKADLKDKEMGGYLESAVASLEELFVFFSHDTSDLHLDWFFSETSETKDLISSPFMYELNKEILGGKDAKELEYGFSPYYSRFDPYRKLEGKGGVVWLLNKLTSLKRAADVLAKAGNAVTDNDAINRAQSLFKALDNLSGFVHSMQWFANIGGFNYYKLEGKDNRDRSLPVVGGFRDEWMSGISARWQTAVERVRDEEKKEKQATLETKKELFDLEGVDDLVITWDDNPEDKVIIPPPSGKPELRSERDVGLDENKMKLVVSFNDEDPKEINFNPCDSNEEICKNLNSELDKLINANVELITGNDVTPKFSFQSKKIDGYDGELKVSLIGSDMAALERLGIPFHPLPFSSSAGDVAKVVGEELGNPPYNKGKLKINDAETYINICESNEKISTKIKDSFDWIESGLEEDGRRIFIRLKDNIYRNKISVKESDLIVLWRIGILDRKESSGEVRLTAEDLSMYLKMYIDDEIGIEIEVDNGKVTFTSKTVGDGSRVKFNDSLFSEALGLRDAEKEIGQDPSALEEFENDINRFKSINHEIQKWPEDARNLARPLSQAVRKVIKSADSVKDGLSSLKEVLTGSPPGQLETIGMFAGDGITLGTQDRLVASGSKGIIFIADGAEGEEDHGKFVWGEGLVKRSLDEFELEKITEIGPKMKKKYKSILDSIKNKTIAKKLFGEPDEEEKNWTCVNDGQQIKDINEVKPSLGFRVISDSITELTGTTSAQLLALGRGKLEGGADGGEGIGIARLAASYAAEVAGIKKVVISARGEGKNDEDGGRVEVAGKTIAIGGIVISDEDINDFGAKEYYHFGIKAPELTKQYFGRGEGFKPDLSAHAWPEGLQKGHPQTERVLVHANKESVIVVGPYMIKVNNDELQGITIGQRTPNKNSITNEFNDEMPKYWLNNETIAMEGYGNKDERVSLEFQKNKAIFSGGKKEESGQVVLDGTSATIKAGESDQIIIKKGSGIEMKASKIGTEAKGNLTLNGAKVQIA